jgi:hypothetical protein
MHWMIVLAMLRLWRNFALNGRAFLDNNMIHPYYTIGLRDWVPVPSDVYEAYYFRHNILTDETTANNYAQQFGNPLRPIGHDRHIVNINICFYNNDTINENSIFKPCKIAIVNSLTQRLPRAQRSWNDTSFMLYLYPCLYEFKSYKYDVIRRDRAALNSDIIKSVTSIECV